MHQTKGPLRLSLSKPAGWRFLLALVLPLAAGTAQAEAALTLPEIDYIRGEKSARAFPATGPMAASRFRTRKWRHCGKPCPTGR